MRSRSANRFRARRGAPLTPPLGRIELTQDRGLTKLGRAFAAAALGGVGDKDLLPWNVPLSVDVNYATGIDTLTNGSTGVLDIL